MKHLFKIMIPAFAACLVAVACKPVEDDTTFGISKKEILADAKGGTEEVKVTASGDWIATTDVPWIAVSPANGRGSVECKINIDTTVLWGGTRKALVRFESVTDDTSLTLNVEQYGYDKFVILSTTEVSVPEYATTGKRVFDVDVTANVQFNIGVSGTGNWVRYDNFNFTLDRDARPRKIKVRFRYDSNTRPEERTARISFSAKDGSPLSDPAAIVVSQKKAPPIEDNRQGDSLAIIAITRSINYDMGKNEGESMDKWSFVKLWEVTDEGYTPDKKGRLRAVRFQSFHTWLNSNDFAKSDELPYELIYLRTVEDLTLFGNDNYLLLSLGTSTIGELTQLKRLTLYAIGLNRLNDDFVNLKNLEYLDISGNNFNEVPVVLTPGNFPNLTYLNLTNSRRWEILDLSTTARTQNEWGGLYGDGTFPERLLEWDNLEYLYIGNNFIHGTIPDMAEYTKYTAGDEYITARGDTILSAVGLPRVLPRAKQLAININYLKGNIPEWLLKHPNLDEWNPQAMIFNQQNRLLDVNGNISKFDNVPANDDYYYELYPLKKPEE